MEFLFDVQPGSFEGQWVMLIGLWRAAEHVAGELIDQQNVCQILVRIFLNIPFFLAANSVVEQIEIAVGYFEINILATGRAEGTMRKPFVIVSTLATRDLSSYQQSLSIPQPRLETTKTSGWLRVGHSVNALPWAFRNDHGGTVGYDMELLHRLAGITITC